MQSNTVVHCAKCWVDEKCLIHDADTFILQKIASSSSTRFWVEMFDCLARASAVCQKGNEEKIITHIFIISDHYSCLLHVLMTYALF